MAAISALSLSLAATLQALVAYGSRYAQVLRPSGLEFQPPNDLSAFSVVERLEGDATTDFGAPGAIAELDREAIDQDELERLKTILQGCWAAFDRAAQAAEDKELRKGPRGGGRDLDKMLEHVTGAEQAYVRALGWKPEKWQEEDPQGQLRHIREEALRALEAAAKGELPEQGPRGGKRWPPRYFVRRAAWHVLDHAWEIEDRVMD